MPVVEISNHLLIQLLVLKQEGGKTFDETASFLSQLIPDAELSRLQYLLIKAEENVQLLQDVSQREKILSEPVHVEHRRSRIIYQSK